MVKYSIDFNELEKKLQPKKMYRLAEVKDRIEKVAFDIVRFRDNNDTDMLWHIEDTNDGPVIVALYDEETGALSKKQSDWKVVPDQKQASVHIYYKGEPITMVKAAEAGIPENEINLFSSWLPEKIAKNENIKGYVLNKMGTKERNVLVARFPELRTK